MSNVLSKNTSQAEFVIGYMAIILFVYSICFYRFQVTYVDASGTPFFLLPPFPLFSHLQLYNLSGEPERKEFLDKLFDYMQKKGKVNYAWDL